MYVPVCAIMAVAGFAAKHNLASVINTKKTIMILILVKSEIYNTLFLIKCRHWKLEPGKLRSYHLEHQHRYAKIAGKTRRNPYSH